MLGCGRGERGERILSLEPAAGQVTNPGWAYHQRAVLSGAHEQPADVWVLLPQGGD